MINLIIMYNNWEKIKENSIKYNNNKKIKLISKTNSRIIMQRYGLIEVWTPKNSKWIPHGPSGNI